MHLNFSKIFEHRPLAKIVSGLNFSSLILLFEGSYVQSVVFSGSVSSFEATSQQPSAITRAKFVPSSARIA